MLDVRNFYIDKRYKRYEPHCMKRVHTFLCKKYPDKYNDVSLIRSSDTRIPYDYVYKFSETFDYVEHKVRENRWIEKHDILFELYHTDDINGKINKRVGSYYELKSLKSIPSTGTIWYGYFFENKKKNALVANIGYLLDLSTEMIEKIDSYIKNNQKKFYYSSNRSGRNRILHGLYVFQSVF